MHTTTHTCTHATHTHTHTHMHTCNTHTYRHTHRHTHTHTDTLTHKHTSTHTHTHTHTGKNSVQRQDLLIKVNNSHLFLFSRVQKTCFCFSCTRARKSRWIIWQLFVFYCSVINSQDGKSKFCPVKMKICNDSNVSFKPRGTLIYDWLLLSFCSDESTDSPCAIWFWNKSLRCFWPKDQVFIEAVPVCVNLWSLSGSENTLDSRWLPRVASHYHGTRIRLTHNYTGWRIKDGCVWRADISLPPTAVLE